MSGLRSTAVSGLQFLASWAGHAQRSLHKRGVVYHYNPGRAHTVILELLLEDFKGYLHCDGYSAYDTYARVAPSITLVACWMHARRKFYEVAQSSKTEGLAHAALAKISALYKLEKEAKESALDPNAIYQMRQQNAKPILGDFKIWLDENSLCVLPKSPLGQAIGYRLCAQSMAKAYSISEGWPS